MTAALDGARLNKPTGYPETWPLCYLAAIDSAKTIQLCLPAFQMALKVTQGANGAQRPQKRKGTTFYATLPPFTGSTFRHQTAEYSYNLLIISATYCKYVPPLAQSQNPVAQCSVPVKGIELRN